MPAGYQAWDYTVAFYTKVKSLSQPYVLEGEECFRFEGRPSVLFKELFGTKANYKTIKDNLIDLGCIAQAHRGAGQSINQTEWYLFQSPEAALQHPIPSARLTSLTQSSTRNSIDSRFNALNRRVQELETSLVALNRRLLAQEQMQGYHANSETTDYKPLGPPTTTSYTGLDMEQSRERQMRADLMKPLRFDGETEDYDK